jgi:membrane protein DedA with SNARE-associated domain
MLEFIHNIGHWLSLGAGELARHHGDVFYFITFIWTMLEGETFVIFAGMAVYNGLLQAHWLILAAWFGSFAGDQIFFWLGRKFGKRIIAKFPKLARPRGAILHWVERHATGFILTYRFMYGLRNISAIVVGMTDIPWRRFAALNLLAALIWAVAFVAVGYFFANAAHSLVENSAIALTGAIAAIFVVVLLAKRLVKRRMETTKVSDSEQI